MNATEYAAYTAGLEINGEFAIGDTVSINDPKWFRHGEVGTVVKVNRVTIRVQMGATDWVTGGKVYFTKVAA